jgi:hypothetical protein
MSVEREYKTRIGSAPRNFRARPGSHPENGEHRTSNQNGESASLPATSSIASTEDDALLSPPNGERNEVRGVDESQAAGIGETTSTNLNSTSSPRPSPPLHGGEGDGFAAMDSSSVSGEHRTSNAQHRTSNQNGETSLRPEAHGNAAAQYDGILSPPNGERNEVRGFDESQIAESRQSLHQNLNRTSSPRPFPPLHGGEGDGFARASALASGEPRTPNPGSAAVPAASLEPRQRDGPGGRQGAPREHDHVTRQELKRELDSLRRLIESRK